ncbi:hypothetical protein N9W89_12475 [Hellea sp.]|nr:hypothetical protein [Hellea sp.]
MKLQFQDSFKRVVFFLISTLVTSIALVGCITFNLPDPYTGNGTIHLIEPSDPTVSTDLDPTFTFYRSATANIPAASCATSQPGEMAVIIIHETANATTMATSIAAGTTVHSQIIELPDDCIFEINLTDFEPDLYKSYAWTVVSELTTPIESDTNWSRLIFSEYEINLNSLPSTSTNEECLKGGLINDPTFQAESASWIRTDRMLMVGGALAPDLLNGHNDAGAISVNQNTPVLMTELVTPMVASQPYDFELSIKVESVTDQISLRLWGITSPITPVDGLIPSATVQLLEETAPFDPITGSWVRHSFRGFTPSREFVSIAIEIVQSAGTFQAAVDKVGLCNKIKGSPCDQSLDMAEYLPQSVTLPTGVSYPASSEETVVTTDFGAVGNLYPNEDMTTINWLENHIGEEDALGTGPMQCNSIGERDWRDVPPPVGFDEERELKFDAFFEELETWLSKQNIEETPPVQPAPRPVPTPPANASAGPACEANLDPSLPYGGRDIVYVHGLITPHLLDSYSLNQKFAGKWFDQPEDFYSGGAYDKWIKGGSADGRGYWNNHIVQQLGDLENPTNGYLIVNYATTERLNVGMHAVATQIADARDGNNRGYINSQRDADAIIQTGQNPEEVNCFGQNGIVIVSHSTGGLLTSAMLATSEMSRGPVLDPRTILARAIYRSDLGWLSDLTALHVSIDGAQVGSPLAPAGIKTMLLTTPANTPISVFQMFNDGSGLQPAINPFSSILVDLTPAYASTHWVPLYRFASVPTVNLIGSTPGLAAGDRASFDHVVGQLLARGFDDGVNPTISQQAIQLPHHEAPFYRSTLRIGSRWDFGTPIPKAWSMARQGSRTSPLGFPRYFVHPALAPSGMIQSRGVAQLPSNNRFAANHYPLIQSTSSHYDPGTKMIDPAEKDYAQVWFDINNWEETGVILHDDLINLGIVEPDFLADLQRQTRRQLVIPIPYPCGITFNAWSQFSIDWCQFELVIWRRNYLLLNDGGQSQSDLDYVYNYVLR